MHEFVASDRLYGKGVFTTIAIDDGEPFLWEKHWRRLTANTAKLGIDISGYDEPSVANSLSKVIEKNNVSNGRARVTFFDESSSEIWDGAGEKKTGLSIITAGPRTIPDKFRPTISPYRVNSTSPLVGVKSCNYLEHLMAFDEARSRGFDEAIRLNERGQIASACMANVFWGKNEKLYTPCLKTGCLPGTTREYILENLSCEEVEVGIEALTAADAIFLTSAGLGIVQAAALEGRELRMNEHEINSLLQQRAETRE
jgi:branched-subunit amino acid aminotransferase/4-amino-4-deoxychorismate lyase